MSAPAVIAGDFSTFKHVQGRKVLQLVIEVPAEAAASVFSAFGYPGTGSPIPVAVARLVEEPKAEAPAQKEQRSFTSLPLSQQAALRCQEPQFWVFIYHHGHGRDVSSAEDAAKYLYEICGVSSRSEIVAGTRAGRLWEATEAQYWAWQRGAR